MQRELDILKKWWADVLNVCNFDRWEIGYAGYGWGATSGTVK